MFVAHPVGYPDTKIYESTSQAVVLFRAVNYAGRTGRDAIVENERGDRFWDIEVDSKVDEAEDRSPVVCHWRGVEL